MTRSTNRWLALVAILALVLAACGGGDTGEGDGDAADGDTTTTAAADDETTTTEASEEETTTTTAEDDGEAPMEGEALSLGTVLPLTGDLAPFGPGMENAVTLAVDQANAAGGVNGADISLTTTDSGTNEDIARNAANELVAEGVQGVVGAASSRISLSIIDIFVQNDVVQVSPSNTSPQFTTYEDDGWYFRTAPSDALQGPVLANVVLGDDVNNVALIALADSYGQGLADAFAEAYEAEGGTVVTRVNYDPRGTNFDAEVTQVAEAEGIEGVVMVGFPETGSIIMQAAFEQRLLDLPWYFTDGMKDDTFPESAFPQDPSVVAGFKGTGPGSPSGDGPDQYLAAYTEAYGEDPTAFSSNAYDAAWLLILAAEMGDGTAASIAENMAPASQGGTKCVAVECLDLAANDEDFDYVGASGEIDFDEVGDPGSAFFDIWQFTQDGNVEILETVQR